MRDPRKAVRNPDCTLCPLHENADHVCMMGQGPLPSKIMIVGEAPGAAEDFEGTPFIGPSGKLLDSMLESVGIDRHEDCYVTNVAKCRPEDNETPTRGQVKICVQSYMGEELVLAQPKFILLLGNSALQGLVGKSGITKHRGSVWEAKGAQIFATFHPAAVLRNPKYRAMMVSDFERFARLVRGERSAAPDTKVHIIKTKAQLKELAFKIINAEENSYDIETYCDHPTGTNFQEYRGEHSKIVSIAFTFVEGTSYAVLLHHEDTYWKDPDVVLRVIATALKMSKAKTIAHNGKFDARWMLAKGLPIHQHFDTMLAGHMIDENRVKGLKPLSQLLLGVDAYDVGEELGNAYSMDRKELLIYNAKDTDYTLRLYHRMREELRQEPRVARVFTKLMMPASNVLVEVENHGIQLDMKRWKKRFKQAQAIEEKIRRYMLQYVPVEKREGFNFASPKQVGAWIFDDLGLPIIEETKTGAPSTKESVLLILGKQHKAVAAMLKWRKWKKYMTTYFLPWRDLRDENDRIHPTYKLFGTVTGRLSCADPNLQQVPRDPFIRGILGARRGWRLVVADYSQVELRIAAMMANESTMLAQFARGEDIHMIRACKMTGKLPKDVTKEERKAAKPVSFGFLYGMGAPKFVDYARDSYDVHFTLDEAEEVRYQFFNDYPRLLTWHERQRRLARRYSRVQSPIGRVRHLPDIHSKDRAVQGEAERQAINSPVQSFASDLMLLALIELHRMMPKDEAIIVGTVHDSILAEVRDDVVDVWKPRIKETMEDMSIVRRKFGTDVTVPIVADIEVGTHWGETS